MNNAPAAKEQALQRQMRKLSEEIKAIESTIYLAHDNDPYNQRFLLQQQRNHAIRGAVLELHLAIEDLLNVGSKRIFSAASQSSAMPPEEKNRSWRGQ